MKASWTVLSLAVVLSACATPGQTRSGSFPTQPKLDTAGRAVASCSGALPAEVTRHVNEVRARGYQCGSKRMGPAAALKWDRALFAAAADHSVDMARRDYVEHKSPEGVGVTQRVSSTPYNWKSLGENLAGGSTEVTEVVQRWLESPDHCENLLDPKFVDVAVACVAEPQSQWGTYWTMVLARK